MNDDSIYENVHDIRWKLLHIHFSIERPTRSLLTLSFCLEAIWIASNINVPLVLRFGQSCKLLKRTNGRINVMLYSLSTLCGCVNSYTLHESWYRWYTPTPPPPSQSFNVCVHNIHRPLSCVLSIPCNECMNFWQYFQWRKFLLIDDQTSIRTFANISIFNINSPFIDIDLSGLFWENYKTCKNELIACV